MYCHLTEYIRNYRDTDKFIAYCIDRSVVERNVSIYYSRTFRLSQNPISIKKCVIVDNRIVWYGSINLLSYGSAGETMIIILINVRTWPVLSFQ